MRANLTVHPFLPSGDHPSLLPLGRSSPQETVPAVNSAHSLDPSCFLSSVCCVSAAQSCLTLQPHGLQPARLLCPWNSPGMETKWGLALLPQPTSV